MILKELKRKTKKFLKIEDDVINAVITVPAYFNNSQRQATKQAAEMVGFKVLQLLNEPTAAALAYGFQQKPATKQNILVFDMGGGTFDVTVLTINGQEYTVKAVDGDLHLGGQDFNKKLLDYFAEEIDDLFEINIMDHSSAKSRVLSACEDAKIKLSTSDVADVKIVGLCDGEDFESTITRARFEDLNDELFNRSIKIVEKTLAKAKLQKGNIDEVVLVGGSTFIPKVQAMLGDFFDGKQLNKSVKADEAVAIGAAICAANLNGDIDDDCDITLLDVTRFSLGLEVGKVFHKLIKRFTKIPTRASSSCFTPARPGQSVVAIRVYEGERKLARENNLLGEFFLKNLPTSAARKLQIRISFDIDSDGLLKVSAEEVSSGIKNEIEVDAFADNLSEELREKISAKKKYLNADKATIASLLEPLNKCTLKGAVNLK